MNEVNCLKYLKVKLNRTLSIYINIYYACVRE